MIEDSEKEKAYPYACMGILDVLYIRTNRTEDRTGCGRSSRNADGNHTLRRTCGVRRRMPKIQMKDPNKARGPAVAGRSPLGRSIPDAPIAAGWHPAQSSVNSTTSARMVTVEEV